MRGCATNDADFAATHALGAWLRDERSERAAVVGVVNVTPDSFSDGGRFLDVDAACAHVDRLLVEGADVVEIGGESTRPASAAYGDGYRPVDAPTQIARTLPVIRYAIKAGARVAIDTTEVIVARAALDAGVGIVNDVSCLADARLASIAADAGAWLVLMHSRPGATSSYVDVVSDIAREWSAARARAIDAGLSADRIVFDPGLGFGKGARDNMAILRRLGEFRALGHAIYVGASRKSFIAHAEVRAGLAPSAPNDRLGGTIAASLAAIERGAAAVRVHDVRAMRQAIVIDRWMNEGASLVEGRDA